MKRAGVVMVMAWPDGAILTHAADFEGDDPQMQEYRARDALYLDAARRLCNPAFAECVTRYQLADIFRSMIQNKGFTVGRLDVEYPIEIKEPV